MELLWTIWLVCTVVALVFYGAVGMFFLLRALAGKDQLSFTVSGLFLVMLCLAVRIFSLEEIAVAFLYAVAGCIVLLLLLALDAIWCEENKNHRQ